MEALLRLVWFPYWLWKTSTASSRIGLSPMEEEALAFWRRFAWVGTAIVILAIVGGSAGLAWFLKQPPHQRSGEPRIPGKDADSAQITDSKSLPAH